MSLSKYYDSFAGVYDRGIAVGHSSIRNDAIDFAYREERFTFPVVQVVLIAHWNGFFYEASIDDLRRLAEKN